MCTLLTLDRATWDADQPGWARRVLDDARANPDGLAVLVAKASGEYSSLRTQDSAAAIGFLAASDWTRCWVHARYGTGGEPVLEHTHGFCSRGVWYMHNGFIRQPPAATLPVDSMAIGKWIQDNEVYDRLAKEHYANVFLVAPHAGVWTMVRAGAGGSLYTDGLGNFATVATGEVSQAVPPGTTLTFDCPKRSRWRTYSAPWSPNAPSPSRQPPDSLVEWRKRRSAKLRGPTERLAPELPPAVTVEVEGQVVRTVPAPSEEPVPRPPRGRRLHELSDVDWTQRWLYGEDD